MEREKNFSIRKITKREAPVPSSLLLEVKNEILGKEYDLSLVFTGKSHSKKLNQKHRGKNKATNVLSFPLEENLGEIFIDLETAKKEASSFDMDYQKFVLYLFIHACLHLKGLDHGSRMNEREDKFLSKFQEK